MMCEVPRCRQEGAITWLGKEICEECFIKHSDDNNTFNLYTIFKMQKKETTPARNEESLFSSKYRATGKNPRPKRKKEERRPEMQSKISEFFDGSAAW